MRIEASLSPDTATDEGLRLGPSEHLRIARSPAGFRSLKRRQASHGIRPSGYKSLRVVAFFAPSARRMLHRQLRAFPLNTYGRDLKEG